MGKMKQYYEDLKQYCEHSNTEYIQKEDDVNVHESIMCIDCGASLRLPQPDDNLEEKIMDNAKEILRGCQEYEDEMNKLDLHSSDRLVNKGWIEACNFFLKNFTITEKGE